jgi:Spy/CpxP family protein refolding chaperone
MRQQMRRIGYVAAAVLLGVAAAQAQPSQGSGPKGPGPQGPGLEQGREHGSHAALSHRLGLSEEQQETFRALMDEQRPQLEALHEKLSANREALHALLESGSADAAAVGELVLEGRKLQGESRAVRESGQKAIRGILTPEQQKKFDAMQERRRERGPQGQGQHGTQGGPGGPGMHGGSGRPGMQKPRQASPGQAPVQPPVQP